MSFLDNIRIIQGGMGVNISSANLARLVSSHPFNRSLGTVSGVALDALVARQLQTGDPNGDIRAAFAALGEQVPAMQKHLTKILARYFRIDGKPPNEPFVLSPKPSLNPSVDAAALIVAGTFATVWLAKRGHSRPVAINFMRKLELSLIHGLYGAMLAGADVVAMGAGVPGEIPGVLDNLSRGLPTQFAANVLGAQEGEQWFIKFDPRNLLGDAVTELPRPKFLAIVSSDVLSKRLSNNPITRPDGLVIENFRAGGHNAPPRKIRGAVIDPKIAEWGAKDEPNIAEIAKIGLPFWLAGAYGNPRGLIDALQAGANGIQVGTLFALCQDSGMTPALRSRILRQIAEGKLHVRSDRRASPSGFPFEVAEVEGTVSQEPVYEARPRICDLGHLVSLIRQPDGSVKRACPAEPREHFVAKGGAAERMDGALCVCNGLVTTAGLGQMQRSGHQEPQLVTLGVDLTPVNDMLARHPDRKYTAYDAIDYLYSLNAK